MKIKILLFVILCTGFVPLGSTQTVLPLNRDIQQCFERALIKKNAGFHSSMKPFIDSDLKKIINFDSICDYSNRDSSIVNHLKHPWYFKKLRREHLFLILDGDFSASVDPLFDFQLGRDLQAKTNHYVNTRGVTAEGKIGKELYFQTSFYENQATFVEYLSVFVDSFDVVPGQGKAKKFKANGYDYSMASGMISWSPLSRFNFQFGHGKNFIGDGYRSLLLSDNAFNYPFLKTTYTHKKLQYTNIYAVFQDMHQTIMDGRAYQKKYATFHYLNYLVCPSVSIGLFESTLWQARINNQNKNPQWYYLNPLITSQTFISGLSAADNNLLGLNLAFNIKQRFKIYSQFILDDWDLKKSSISNEYLKNKFGYQAGIKYFDVFNIRNLYLQYEYNRVRPYTYAHNNVQQNYTHYNQAIAHPLGANFAESLCILNYRYKDFFVELKVNYLNSGMDTGNAYFGGNLFVSDLYSFHGINSTGNELGQGAERKLFIVDLRLQYLLNPNTNMNLVLGLSDRNNKITGSTKNSRFIYFGIRTSISNHYYDF